MGLLDGTMQIFSRGSGGQFDGGGKGRS